MATASQVQCATTTDSLSTEDRKEFLAEIKKGGDPSVVVEVMLAEALADRTDLVQAIAAQGGVVPAYVDKIRVSDKAESEPQIKEGEGDYDERGTSSIREQGEADNRQGDFDFLATTGLSGSEARQQIEDELHQAWNLRTTGSVQIGLDRITNVSDAIHVFASIRKSAQERFMFAVTDGDGKILSIVNYGKGVKDGATIHPMEVAAAVADVDGGKKVWLAHNHPSGTATASSSDERITSAINNTLDGLGVELAGHVVIGKNGESSYIDKEGFAFDMTITPTAASRGKSFNVSERMLSKVDTKDREQISSPASATRLAESIGSEDAIILLNTKHAPVGVVAIGASEMKLLRDGKQVRRILKMIGRANASAAIIKTNSEDAARNVSRFLNNQSGGVRVLDWLSVVDGETTSSSERGSNVTNDSGTFFSVGGENSTPKSPAKTIGRKDADSVVSRVVTDWAGGIDRITLVSTYADLPEPVQEVAERQDAANNVYGVYQDGKIYIVLDKHKTSADVERTIFHEAYGHYGFNALFGEDLRKKMNNIFIAMGGSKGVERLARENKVNIRPYVKAFNDEYKLGKISADMRNSLIMEELLAGMTETNNPTLKRLISEVYGAIRAWLSKHKFTALLVATGPRDADISNLLRLSRKAVKSGVDSNGKPMLMVAADYRSDHAAPDADFGSPLHNVTDGMYPDDFYSSKGLQYYGTGDDIADRQSYNVIMQARDNPDKIVTAYRAVPYNKDGPITDEININEGDWVTLSKEYAKGHGESVLNGNYKIVTKKIKAKDLYTNADSLNEFGYSTKSKAVEQKADPLFSVETPGTPAYESAKAKGLDMSLDARMERAKEMGFDTGITYYHGAPDSRGIWEEGFVDKFEAMKEGEGGHHFFSSDKRVANTYADDSRAFDYQNSTPETIPAYLKLGRSKKINWKGRPFRSLRAGEDYNLHDEISKAKKEGFNSIVVDNIIDTYNSTGLPGNVTVIFDSAQVRSIDAAFDPDMADSANIMFRVGDDNPTGGNTKWKDEPGYQDLPEGTFESLGKFGKPPNPPIMDRAKERFAEIKPRFGTKLRQEVLDQYDSIKSVLNNKRAWMLSQLSGSAGGAIEMVIQEGGLQLHKDGVLQINTKMKGLAETLAPLGNESNRFLQWVAANRASRLWAEDKEHLLTEQDIQNLLALNKNTTANPTREATYAAVLKDFEALHNSVVKVGVETGLVSQEDAALWKEQGFYVPFYRIAEEGGDNHGVSSVSGMVGQTAYKKLKGANMQLNDLLMNTVMNWEHIASASLKNQAATETLKTAVDMGLATRLDRKPSKVEKSHIFVRENGQEVWYHLDSTNEGKLVLQSISSLNFNGLDNTPMKVMRKFKRMLTIGVTASPEFKIANLIRDTIQAIAVAPMDTNFLKNVNQGWNLTSKMSEERVQAIAAGGLFGDSGYINGGDPDAIRTVMSKHISQAEILDTEHKIKKWWNKYQDLGARLENVNRISNVKQSLDAGKDLLTANFEGRDHLDFQRSGANIAVRVLTQSIPFLNARMQGLDKMGRAFADPEQRKQTIAVIGAYSAASVLLYLYMRDDEEYKEAEQWERDTYHLIRLPGSDNMIRIPRPFETGALANIIERGVEQFVDPDVDMSLYYERLQHMLTETLAFSIVPQALAPALDIRANKSSFTGRQIESMAMQRLSPENRIKPWTTQSAIGLSKLLSIPMGDNGLSPIQIDFLVSQYTGWAGSTVLNGLDLMARPALGEASRPEMKIQDYPVIGRFVREAEGRNSKYITELYDNKAFLAQKFADIKHYKANKEVDKLKEAMAKHGKDLRYRKRYNREALKLSKLSNDIKRITNRKDLSPREKSRRIDAINARRLRIARMAVTRGPIESR